jgi:hypothetical protein
VTFAVQHNHVYSGGRETADGTTVDVMKLFFYLSLTKRQNKVEFLTLASLSSLVKYMHLRPEERKPGSIWIVLHLDILQGPTLKY